MSGGGEGGAGKHFSEKGEKSLEDKGKAARWPLGVESKGQGEGAEIGWGSFVSSGEKKQCSAKKSCAESKGKAITGTFHW